MQKDNIKHKGGRPRNHKKVAPTTKFLSVNKMNFPGIDKKGKPREGNHMKIRNVGGFNWGQY